MVGIIRYTPVREYRSRTFLRPLEKKRTYFFEQNIWNTVKKSSKISLV